MTHILSARPVAHNCFRDLQTVEARAAAPAKLTRPASLSFAATAAVIVLVAINLRPGIVSIGPLLPHIRQEFGISNAQASLLTAIPAMLMGLLAFPTPWLAHKLGRDKVILIALVGLMLTTTLRALSGSIGMLLASTFGVGAGIAIVGALIPGFAKKTFPRHAAVLMGIYAMSLGLGSTLAAGLTEPLANLSGGWRFSSGVFALPCFVAIAAWLVVARTERGLKLLATESPQVTRRGLPFRKPTAWLIALYFAANNVLFFGFVSWTAPMFREYGMSPAAAGFLLASFTAAFMVSNPLAGLISRGEDRRVVIALFAALALVGCTAVAISPDLLPFLFIPVIAFGVGGSFTLGMILPLDNAVDAHDANGWTAFVIGIGYFAGALGPLLLGILRDSTGGFSIPLWILAAVAMLMVALSPFLQPHRHHRRRAGK
ncbi:MULTISPECIES: CynX/NimT family MFS transporter [Rhizobium/Agrobacterium group]|uniref:MFS transporter n=1 Tax=Rhizobium rhizogenes TaxID=359 RepID=A0A546X3D1_RHIRH|nr:MULTISPECIES: MFS transporter [Rhizobium/Agrobacterium group]TRA95269.1 MFS transporter [Rhizobium rhizogenes]